MIARLRTLLAVLLLGLFVVPAPAQTYDSLGIPFDADSVLAKGACEVPVPVEAGFSGTWYSPALPGVYLHVQAYQSPVVVFGTVVNLWLNAGWHPTSIDLWATWGAGSTTQATQDTLISLRQPFHRIGQPQAGHANRSVGTVRARWHSQPRIELTQTIPPLAPQTVLFYPQRLAGKPPACPDLPSPVIWIRGG